MTTPSAHPLVDLFRKRIVILDGATGTTLRTYGMKAEEIELFADSVMQKQTRLLANNYVELTRDEIRDIYKSLF